MPFWPSPARPSPGAAGCRSVQAVMPLPFLSGLIALGDVLGEPLPAVERLVDAHLPGDRRAHVLRHLGAEVGELGDVDELDADRGPRLYAGVARVGAGDGRLGGLRERLRHREVLLV